MAHHPPSLYPVDLRRLKEQIINLLYLVVRRQVLQLVRQQVALRRPRQMFLPALLLSRVPAHPLAQPPARLTSKFC